MSVPSRHQLCPSGPQRKAGRGVRGTGVWMRLREGAAASARRRKLLALGALPVACAWKGLSHGRKAPGERKRQRQDWQGWPQGAAAGMEALPPGPARPALPPTPPPSPLPSPSLLPLRLRQAPRGGASPPNAFQVWTRPLPHPGQPGGGRDGVGLSLCIS